MKEKDIQIIQGDSFYITLTKYDKEGDQVDFLATDKIEFSAKRNLKQEDYDIHSDSTTLSEGQIILYLSPEDTEVKLGTYYYDIQYTTPNNDIYTLVKGKLDIVWEVTDNE